MVSETFLNFDGKFNSYEDYESSGSIGKLYLGQS
jgi:hypothetical protein